MKMHKLICLGLLVTNLSIAGFAQKSYQKAVGLRISSSYYDLVSASYKFFISDAGAIELNGGFGLKSYSHGHYVGNVYYDDGVKPFTLAISGSYQHHFEIPVRRGGLSWFVGGGITGYRVFSSAGDYDGFGFGIFPTGGIDFKIPNIPLAVSADYRPTIFLAQPSYYDSFYGGNFGVAARYTFGDK